MAYLHALIHYVQPLLGLLVGMVVIGVVAYLNWYGTIKQDVVSWISSRVFGGQI
jgi:hypothetical protein